MKRKLATRVVIALVAAVGLFMLYGKIVHHPVTEWVVVATVNNEPIYAREFKVEMAENRAEIYAYFKRNYGADGGKTFWTDRYGEESPLDRIRKITLDELVQFKVQQILLKAYGIQADIGYKSFIAAWEETNKQRQKDLKRNKVIYGPAAYGEAEYSKYLFNNRVNQLKERLSEHEFGISDDKLRQMYNEEKSGLYAGEEFSDVKQIIKFKYIDQAYEEWIERHVEEADVLIDAKVYNAIEAI